MMGLLRTRPLINRLGKKQLFGFFNKNVLYNKLRDRYNEVIAMMRRV